MSAIGRHVSMLSGYVPALPTPFDDEGGLDRGAHEQLCDLQIREGATALVVCDTAGEAPTLSVDEHRELIRIAIGICRGRVPVIAGAGSNSTEHAIELTKIAEAAGADAILSVVPYYNKPTQIGLCHHFRELSVWTGLPIFLHDVPSRTVCSLADETVARLAELPQIIGLKDAAGDPARPSRLRPLVGSHFRLLSGDDATALAFLAHGGNGCISVTSNVAPGLCRTMFLAYRQGHIARAQRLAAANATLTDALLRESSPAPLKYVLSLFNLMLPNVRLPLVEPSDQTKRELADVITRACDGYAEGLIGPLHGASDSNRRAIAS